MNDNYLLGWDIGGAHVKAALLDSTGALVAVVQQPCPLWQGLGQLQTAIGNILQRPEVSNLQPNQHAITMTGELVDLFSSRDEGVKQILATLSAGLLGQELYLFAGRSGLIKAEMVKSEHFSEIASANWLASSMLAANYFANGLFVDIGSTTTDVIVFKNGEIIPEGFSDYQRLVSGELVYTGIIRTPVMAVAQSVVDQNQPVSLMAEYFATTADIYRVTGELNERHDQSQTADGAEKTVAASARRLARMIGCDYHGHELDRWRKFAEAIRSQQIFQIKTSCQTQLKRCRSSEPLSIIGAGVGRFLAREIAGSLSLDYRDFSELFVTTTHVENGMTAADCAPAVAVAALLRQQNNG